MFRRQKSPIVTATFCREMEDVRMALEVMFGQPVRFRQIDFNTGRAAARLGSEEKSFSFFFGRLDLLHFSIWNEAGEPKEWYLALFEKLENGSDEVRVIKDHENTHKCGDWDMWWIGKSYTERREEPLYMKQAEYCANVRGLLLEQFLKLESE